VPELAIRKDAPMSPSDTPARAVVALVVILAVEA